ncbi:hypothetical protein [Endozoicomonas arenosclerae]|uniref:hypothetical protein n=1 Tax=Endozoicomonas arenosclerae TaxID=1633495 RepID=UPI00078109BE|nr:hypothetical protein [Endozoicomonas arenosclerae]
MDKKQFITEIERRLRELFSASKRSQRLPSSVKHRCEGFMHAGVFMGLVTNDELETLMEQIHLDIFGKTIEQAKRDKAYLWQEEVTDYSLYDSPPKARGMVKG